MAEPSGQEFFLTISTGGADLHRLVQEELREKVAAQDIERFGQARFFFKADVAGRTVGRFESLCTPEKLYAVVLRQPTSEIAPQLAGLSGVAAEEALAAHIAGSGGWARALETWRAFAEHARVEDVASLPRSFRVTGKRAGKLLAHLSSIGISEIVGEAVAQARDWQVALRGYDVEVTVQVNDEVLIVALPLLERSGQQSTFALPGLAQPVAWAMARSAEITPGDIVVDPMCGSGIILLEAAQCWSDAVYLGFDKDSSQLARSIGNRELLSTRARASMCVARGDAVRLPLADASCDVVLCDLPFGKQFGSEEENETLYPAALREFLRILKPGTGRAVLLTNQANAQRLANAFLDATESWLVTCRRKLTLGFMEAVLFLATVQEPGSCSGASQLPAECMRLPWEDGRGRAKWTSFKAQTRAPLQPVMGQR